MSASILVATPHKAFGELLRLSLEESGQYKVRFVTTANEARTCASQSTFQAAILDSDLEDGSFIALSRDLTDQCAGIRLIVIPPDNDPNHPTLGDLMPDAYLTRPFYVPDLLETVGRLTGSQEPHAEETPEEEVNPRSELEDTLPVWLRDADQVKSYLQHLFLPKDVSGAVVVRKDFLFTHTGSLSADEVNELTEILLRYWNPQERTDLIRYVRLPNTMGDYLVYASPILGDLFLALVFLPTASLSLARQITRQAARALSQPPFKDGATEPVGGYTLAEVNASDRATIDYPPPSIESNPLDDTEIPKPDEVEPGEPSDDLEHSFDLSMMLGSIPSPDPASEKEDTASQPADKFTPYPGNDALFGWKPEPWVVEESQTRQPEEQKQGGGSLLIQVESEKPQPIIIEPDVDPLSDTRPHVLRSVTRLNQLEPTSPALSLLNYTCVLVPRMPQHFLIGDTAEQLGQWVQNLCLAFGWRLEGISIRPEYLQWMVQVAPSVSPGNMVKIIRQRTSYYLFNAFEAYKQQNPSGDFWATGYLIISGPQPPSAQLLRDYITQTRKRQGLLKP